MTKPNISWRNAALPPKTAVFTIGDIHSHDQLLAPLLANIKKKIAELPADTTVHVIGIGDYIDRGTSAPNTVDMLLKFKQDMARKPQPEKGFGKRMVGWVKRLFGFEDAAPAPQTPNVITTFLCGNHDEEFHRILQSRVIKDELRGDANDLNDLKHYATYDNSALTLRGIEGWLNGGGLQTVKHYIPEFDESLFDAKQKSFKRDDPRFSIGMVNNLIKTLQARVPQAHKDFFTEVYKNDHIIVGDYLFTHAGISPDKPLAAQGVGPGAAKRSAEDYLEFLMIRNPFLWRDDDNLPNCPYVVVHGHTPSEIKNGGNAIADGQKNYRLCVDSDVCKDGGALTCFMRYGDEASFIAVNKNSPEKVQEYSIPQIGQQSAEIQHTFARDHEKYHKQSPLLAEGVKGDTSKALAILQQREAQRSQTANRSL